MKPECSLWSPQTPATDPYLQPHESSMHPKIILFFRFSIDFVLNTYINFVNSAAEVASYLLALTVINVFACTFQQSFFVDHKY
jgi:hypothetical protein